MAEKNKLKRIKDEILGVVTLLGGLYLLLCLVSRSKWDPSPFTFTSSPAKNYGGIVGAYISDIMFVSIGISSFAVPVFLILYGIKKLFGGEGDKIYLLGSLLFILSSSMLISLMTSTFGFKFESNIGGLTGLLISDFLKKLLSIPGTFIFAMSVFFSSIILLSPVSIVHAIFKKKHRGSDQGENEEPEIEIDLPETAEPIISQTEIKPLRTGLPSPKNWASAKIGEYELPPIELLNTYDQGIRPSKDELLTSSYMLEQKLEDFGVEGKVTQVYPGPVVTLYEFEPAPGVKMNRVISLSDDLALALKASGVRVSAIAGKAAIGIEVPNKNRETVSLREIIASENFRKSSSKLTLALGKDIFGNPIVTDLAKMPHLLVAGSTGSGKSVSLNSMVISILYKASPKEVKMLMIDPKLLELSSYENIPHLISPVITNPKEAADALQRMVFEMERRYKLLAQKGARNIEGYNKQATSEEQLPYIIILIDELADLMFASANEVEDSIARLAQMARASGIHLILATQRPSVDVITGVIKANFPARISFHLASKIDSRTILDAPGAEQLLGKGDMLFILPGVKLIRVHGALIVGEEINSITDFVKTQGEPDYSMFHQIQNEKSEDDGFDSDRDEMYQKAIEYGESTGEISISSIQRRFRIGYNRAARIVELLEKDGYVGMSKGAGKPRDFLRRKR
jgi:S-DNA-T family DNA segregation ATPase FtsK/SpoIIIE